MSKSLDPDVRAALEIALASADGSSLAYLLTVGAVQIARPAANPSPNSVELEGEMRHAVLRGRPVREWASVLYSHEDQSALIRVALAAVSSSGEDEPERTKGQELHLIDRDWAQVGCPTCGRVRSVPLDRNEEPPYCLHHDNNISWRADQEGKWTPMVRVRVFVGDPEGGGGDV